MNIPGKPELAWKKLSQEAVSSALKRLNRVSSGKWKLSWEENLVVSGRVNYDSVCVYFGAGEGQEAMHFALFFDRKDMGALSRNFIGYSFFVSEKMTKTEEMLVSELGNIILNSLVNVIGNKLGRPFIPSVPKIIQAEKEFALEVISAELPENRGKTELSEIISIECGGKEAVCEIFSFIPENMLATLKK